MSKFGPPKQAAVTFSAGIGISNKTFPLLFDNEMDKKINKERLDFTYESPTPLLE